MANLDMPSLPRLSADFLLKIARAVAVIVISTGSVYVAIEHQLADLHEQTMLVSQRVDQVVKDQTQDRMDAKAFYSETRASLKEILDRIADMRANKDVPGVPARH